MGQELFEYVRSFLSRVSCFFHLKGHRSYGLLVLACIRPNVWVLKPLFGELREQLRVFCKLLNGALRA